MPPEVRNVPYDEAVPWLESMTSTFLTRPNVAAIAEKAAPYWDPPRVWGAFDGRVVGTLRSWPSELTVPGGGQVAATALAAVAVMPTHRRRGLLREMIGREHDAARARGEAVGILYASEAPIYGRFGYGLAVRGCTWTLLAKGASFFGEAASGVSYADIDASTVELIRGLHERHRRRVVGEIRRREHLFSVDLGLLDLGWDTTWRGWVIVHRDAAGDADGYVRFSAEGKWEHDQPASVLRVQDFVALDDVAYDALWRFLAEMDWAGTIEAERRSPSERLPWILANRRAAEATDLHDGLWVSLLDMPAALAARRYEHEADMVLEVVEPEPGSGKTRFRLEAGPDGAACTPTGGSPDLTLHASALGAAYLGGSPLRLAAVARGFEEHRPGALTAADALFRTRDEPRCMTFF